MITFSQYIQRCSRWLFPPLCVHCRREGAWLCPEAMQQINAQQPFSLPLDGLTQVIVRGSYDCQPLAQIIQQLKYHYWQGLSEALPFLIQPLSNTFRKFPYNSILVPIPLHKSRQRFRGFNQSQCIAQALGEITGWRAQSLLRRTKNTAAQAQLKAEQRHQNIQGAFQCIANSSVPKHVILVDDVITTGATIQAARAALPAGIEVSAIALAKG